MKFGPLAALAGRQKGLITKRQALAHGYTESVLRVATGNGVLWQVHRGVYAFGTRDLPPDGWEMAAVLACGRDCCLVSHKSAARLWGIIDETSGYRRSRIAHQRDRHPVHVTVLRGQPSRERVVVTRVSRFDDRDRDEIDGIPVTSVARTLLDLASIDRWTLKPALDNARARGLVDNRGLAAVAGRYPRAKGIATFRQLIGMEEGFSRSRAEDRLFKLVAQHRLPKPLRNSKVAGIEVDFVWPDQRLVVEVDGYRFHDTYSRFENDHGRDVALALADYLVLRFTWKQITRQPRTVITVIRETLARRQSQLTTENPVDL